ncbi:hypothetical protein FEM48_Zijuj12G0084600 [Ziziphus jujuba var. spinosa]|uniref:Uncharacterized protein n=1 Tax=Ziziphus jujuba var. spinosa TaxID=714518 RepID=A0A978UC85_ZIZJJ|nr:hypothetical protein FEM48_Zijuj12G0084600 [Ziziphus jujuba var. spinosa]
MFVISVTKNGLEFMDLQLFRRQLSGAHLLCNHGGEARTIQRRKCLGWAPYEAQTQEEEDGSMSVLEQLAEQKAQTEIMALRTHNRYYSHTYSCSSDQSNYLLHKSCADLSHEIQHPLHQKHLLLLLLVALPYDGTRNIICDACHTLCRSSFTYNCSLCNFDLHAKIVGLPIGRLLNRNLTNTKSPATVTWSFEADNPADDKLCESHSFIVSDPSPGQTHSNERGPLQLFAARHRPPVSS